METIVIAVVAFIASGLTFFSGFGLGTILLPAFALFFPIEIAISLTAIVHFLNNIFKLTLVGKNVHWKTVLLFGIPATVFAFVGAKTLNLLTEVPTAIEFDFLGKALVTNWMKIIIGSLLILFSLFDIIPGLKRMKFNEKLLPIGGVLSGFFGGLSGHQGALRSAFLMKLPITKEQFIASGIFIACCIDISRLSVYSNSNVFAHSSININILVIATVAAFTGAFLGNKLVNKITIDILHKIVALLIVVFSICMILGIV